MEDNKVNRIWRTMAIIFIILFLICISVIVWAYNTGTHDIENEKKCLIDICGEDIYTSYYYDSYEKVCTCYDEGGLALTKYLG